MTTVLIAEDASSTRMALKLMLDVHGYEVVAEAADGVEAVEMFMEHHPDVVLMDIAMPRKHGIDAIREILSEAPSARIIVLTALYSTEKRQEVLEAGAHAVITKPFDMEVVMDAIRECSGDMP